MWCQVETYPELLAEYRKYIQGRLPESPNMGGPLHTETLPYVPLLLKMNDGGLLTMESQPGALEFLPDGRVLEQRGYIDAYAPRNLFEHLYSVFPIDDIIMVTNDVEWESAIQGDNAVTRYYDSVEDYQQHRNPHMYTRFPPPSEMEDDWDFILENISPWSPLKSKRFTQDAGPLHQNALLRMSFFDPIWSRGGKIFDVVAEALSND